MVALKFRQLRKIFYTKLVQSKWLWLLLLVFVIAGSLVIRNVVLQANSPTATAINSQIGPVVTERWSGLKNLPEPIKGMAAARYENKFILIGGENAGKNLKRSLAL